MEKEIKIVLDEHLSIKVFVDEEETVEITKDNREITSHEIYESLNIDFKSKYKLAPIQEQEDISDAYYDVLKTFYNLYREIILEVNAIINENNSDNSSVE